MTKSGKEGDFEKKMDYVGKNVTYVAYLLNNSQICAEQHLHSLGWLSAGLGMADAVWGEQFYDWVDIQF